MSETAAGSSSAFADNLAAACELARLRCSESSVLPFVEIDPDDADSVRRRQKSYSRRNR